MGVFLLQLDQSWGPHSVDRFASHLNNKCETFSSRWWVSGTSVIDAFAQMWNYDVNWLVPPPCLIAKCIDKMHDDKAVGTLIAPKWKSAPFWPCLINMDGSVRHFIKEIKVLREKGVVQTGWGNNGCFASAQLPFDLLALKIRF